VTSQAPDRRRRPKAGDEAEREVLHEAGEKLVTASELAAICEADLKTVHTWVERGRIAHFRTPGRHLRFRAADVAGFLRKWGYTVPRELARASAQAVLVVGSQETAAHVRGAVAKGLHMRHAAHGYDALVLAGCLPADVYVVDVQETARDVDVRAMLAALHRASPRATFVALANDPVALPAFCSRVRRDDTAALRVLAGHARGARRAITAP
jgi:excisionase family DNA binding protein